MTRASWAGQCGQAVAVDGAHFCSHNVGDLVTVGSVHSVTAPLPVSDHEAVVHDRIVHPRRTAASDSRSRHTERSTPGCVPKNGG